MYYTYRMLGHYFRILRACLSRHWQTLKAESEALLGNGSSSHKLRSATRTHPRLGVVDHVACNPLGAATCDEALGLRAQGLIHLGLRLRVRGFGMRVLEV